LGFLGPIVTATNLTLILTNIGGSEVYDLYYTTNMGLLPAPALCQTNWAWLYRTAAGQTNIILLAPPSQPECYFILGTQYDYDGDGLPDAWERLVSHTPTNAIDLVSHDGIPDGWLWQHGYVPPSNVGGQDP